MDNLAFKIVNRLLNEKLIIDDIKPSEIEKIVSVVLEANIGQKKTHFRDCRKDWEAALCGQPIYINRPSTLLLTEIRERVTCMRCLKSLALGKIGEAVPAISDTTAD